MHPLKQTGDALSPPRGGESAQTSTVDQVVEVHPLNLEGVNLYPLQIQGIWVVSVCVPEEPSSGCKNSAPSSQRATNADKSFSTTSCSDSVSSSGTACSHESSEAKASGLHQLILSSPFQSLGEVDVHTLDGQNRQSPIARIQRTLPLSPAIPQFRPLRS